MFWVCCGFHLIMFHSCFHDMCLFHVICANRSIQFGFFFFNERRTCSLRVSINTAFFYINWSKLCRLSVHTVFLNLNHFNNQKWNQLCEICIENAWRLRATVRISNRNYKIIIEMHRRIVSRILICWGFSPKATQKTCIQKNQFDKSFVWYALCTIHHMQWLRRRINWISCYYSSDQSFRFLIVWRLIVLMIKIVAC